MVNSKIKTKSGWQKYSKKGANLPVADTYHKNIFGVKMANSNNKIRVFTSLECAVTNAVKNSTKEIIWLNSDIIITVSEMMDSERAKFWKKIIQE